MIRINLDRLTADRGITQAELARLTGIRPSTICDIYNNNASFLKLDNIDKICSVLGCSIGDLLTTK
ncbi:MAG: helix-turn-helix transcriptional regulator [Oscillospiraceae bacterium]|nr:helix-turn-helix transcriptional regulator [Oscillospiraceae bacterium]